MRQKHFFWFIALAVIVIFMPLSAFSADVNIPQTGQTTSYYTGDDGDLQMGVAWPITGNSTSGRFQLNGDGTVTDLLTGLMWTQNANLGGQVNFYTARSAAAALGTGGYADWRIPNLLELESLTNAGVADSAVWLNAEGFTNVQSDQYWSNNSYAQATNGWTINLGTDITGYWMPWDTSLRYYWPVRAGANGAADPAYPANTKKTGAITSLTAGDDGDLEWGVAWPNPRFEVIPNSTVIDHLTDFQWPQDGDILGDNAATKNFTVAMDYIAGMNTGANTNFGYTNWRLPNKKEMYTLVDMEDEFSTDDLLAAGFLIPDFGWCTHWTSTTDPNDSSKVYGVSINTAGSVMETKPYDVSAYTHCRWTSVPFYFWPVRTATDLPWVLAVGILPEGAGSVAGTGITCPPDCTEDYLVATTGITLTATPYMGSTFDFWTGCDSPNGNVCTNSVDGITVGVWANFKVPDVRIEPLALDFGNVDVGSTVQRTVTISSYETVPYTIGTIPALPAPFNTLTDNCSGATLAGLTEYTGVAVGTGDGAATVFNFTLNSPVVERSTVVSYYLPGYWDYQEARDMVSDTGGIYYNDGTGGVDGIINYSTGAVSLTFAGPIPNNRDITVDYNQGPVDSCDLIIEFTPPSEGPFQASLDTPDLKKAILRGTGVAAPAVPTPDIAVSAFDMSFLNTPVGYTFTQSVTVWNEGDATLNFSSITIPASQFSIDADNCSPSLAAAATCTIDVMYTAPGTEGGAHFSTLQIQSDDPDENPVVVNLSGSAIGAGNTPPDPVVLISPANGAVDVSPATIYDWEGGDDPDICDDVALALPAGCDPNQVISQTLYVAANPSFTNPTIYGSASDVMTNGSVMYAMTLFGNPVVIIALFGIIAMGVFLKRKKIPLVIVATVFIAGLLLASCSNHKDAAGGGGGAGGGGAGSALQAGTTHYWKVLTSDGVGGLSESDTWSFTTAP